MLGSYPEASGFNRAHGTSGEQSYQHVFEQLDLPLEFDPCFSSVFGSSSEFDCKALPWIKDFILVAEFSELEGPLPLITYPKYGGKMLDMNSLVVKLLAVDYQSISGAHSCVSDDVQVIQQEIVPGVSAFVNYFTLCDIRARGFVRVSCLAYLTSDFFKLQHLVNHLRVSFLQVTRLLKYGNLTAFHSDMKLLINDLAHTRDCYYVWKKFETGVVPEEVNLSPRELTILSQVNIESLDYQILESHKILGRVSDRLVDEWSGNTVAKWKSFMEMYHMSSISSSVSRICRSWRPNYRLPQIVYSNGCRKLNPDNYRNICGLCGWSCAPALYTLYELQGLFTLPLMDFVLREVDQAIAGVSEEDEAFQGLAIGMSVLSNSSILLGSDSHLAPIVSSSLCPAPSPSSDDDPQIVYVIQNLPFSVLFSPDRIYDVPCIGHVIIEGSDMYSEELTLCRTEVDDFAVFSIQTPAKICLHQRHFMRDLYMSSSAYETPLDDQIGPVKPKSMLFMSVVDFVQCHLGLCADTSVLECLNTFSNTFAHILHSMLVGRTLILAGSEQERLKVIYYVDLMKHFIPSSTVKTGDNVLRWHTGTIVQYHIEKYKLIGLCIPERLLIQDVMSSTTLNQVTILNVETNKIIGPAYSGKYLSGIQSWAGSVYVSEKALLYYLWGVFFDVCCTVFVYNFLKGHTNMDSGGLLTALSVVEGDRSLVKYLNSLSEVDSLDVESSSQSS